ncbi:MAG: hypothetical protein ACUVXI_06485 [bacterium]
MKFRGGSISSAVASGALLIMIAIPLAIYYLSLNSEGRYTLLILAGYIALIVAVFYTVRAIQRSFKDQPPPLLERFLGRNRLRPFIPQEFQRIAEEVEISLRSRRYFRRVLRRRIERILRGKLDSSSPGKVPDELKEILEDGTEDGAEEGLLERFTGRGIPLMELEKILKRIEEL